MPATTLPLPRALPASLATVRHLHVIIPTVCPRGATARNLAPVDRGATRDDMRAAFAGLYVPGVTTTARKPRKRGRTLADINGA